MKLETKVSAVVGVVTFAALASLGVTPVVVVITTAALAFASWHIACALSPDEDDQPTTYTNYEDGPKHPWHKPDDHFDNI